MHDSSGSLVSLADFKALLGDFYEAYPVLAGHNVEMKNILVNGNHAVTQARIEWYGMAKGDRTVIKKEGSSEFRLDRSIYGGWDIIQANIPGWVFQTKT